MFQIYEFLPGAVTRTRTMGQSTLSQCAFRAFFFFEYTTICKTKGHTWLYWWDLTENNYLCDEINELDWGGWHEGNENESTTFYIWCWAQIIDLQRISVECILKNHQRKKPWDPYQLIATVLLNEVDFFFYMKACVIWWLETVFYI